MEQTGHPNLQASRYFRININKPPSTGISRKVIPGSARERGLTTPPAGTASPLSAGVTRRVLTGEDGRYATNVK